MKINDFVKTKKGIVGPDGESLDYIQGRIVKIQHSNPELFTILLDSIAMKHYSLDQIIEMEEEEYNSFQYNIYPEQALPAKPRETPEKSYEEHKKILNKAFDVIISKAKTKEQKNDKIIDKYYRHFRISPYIKKFKQEELSSVANIAIDHIDFMLKYHEQMPENWTIDAMEHVCLKIIPQTFVADLSFFELYAPALIAFMPIIETETGKSMKHISAYLEKIKHEIVIQSEDENNWSFAKQNTMLAKNANIDISNTDDLIDFFK